MKLCIVLVVRGNLELSSSCGRDRRNETEKASNNFSSCMCIVNITSASSDLTVKAYWQFLFNRIIIFLQSNLYLFGIKIKLKFGGHGVSALHYFNWPKDKPGGRSVMLTHHHLEITAGYTSYVVMSKKYL